MKKLLSLLFVLGSVSMLANEVSTLPADADPAFCFTNPCSAETSFDVKVKVPEQLVITAGDVDLGLWCGDKDVDKSIPIHHTIKGEANTKVNVGFKYGGKLAFIKNGEKFSAFGGQVTHKTGYVDLDENGAGTGGIDVHVDQLLVPGKLIPGHEYKATATLVASYDTSSFIDPL
ncbi:hypothetical protein [Cetobacterium sp. 2G large]|uniref:hypothetical protein n=1 Tax=Cetobacterium sp. 2G large TaxID=2759680 RepID=UPI00163B6DE9|nr:hypothetical protein [Cetobacterium sp. 2G large]MBC2854133.1 hypothetical protein [Cetobacterium sp. 2G large]